MKNKIKKHNKKIFFAILLAGLFFGGFLTIKISNAFAIEDQQACTRSGGSWINNKCACPTGKSVLSATGDCGIQSQADANAIINGTPNDQGVDVILDSSDLNFSKTPATTQNTKKFNYTLLESFPGFFKAGSTLTDLPTMILAIYKFGIWTVGIAGLFMLVVGGFMYMASAGNTSTAGNARGIIWDALLGIVAALGAYLILYVINPELTKINLSFTPVEVTETMGTPMGPAGVCKPATTSECSVATLTSTFGSKATEASSICNGESNGKSIASTVDICADGSVASWGLFQINITVHPIGGLPCPSAFTSQYTAKDHSCRVKNDSYSAKLYVDCVVAAKNTSNNIATANSIYNADGNSWAQWGANERSKCYFK